MNLTICKDILTQSTVYSFISNESASINNGITLFSSKAPYIEDSIMLMTIDDANNLAKQWISTNWPRHKNLNVIVCGGISFFEYDEPLSGLNLFCVETDLISTYNILHNHLQNYADCVSAIKNAIINDCTLQELTNIASHYLDAATYILDIGYNVSVATCPNDTIQRLNNIPYITNIINELNVNRMLQPHMIKQLESICQDKRNKQIYYYSLFRNNQIIGYFLIIFLSDNISMLQKTLAEGIYDKLLHFYSRSSQYDVLNQEALFVNNLIEGKFKSHNEITNWFRTLGRNPFKRFACVVIKPKSEDSLICLLSLNSIKQLFLGSIGSIYNKTVVIIAPITEGFHLSFNKQVLQDILHDYDAYCGISFTVVKFTAIPILFKESLSAIRIGSSFHPENNIFYYEEYRRYNNIEICTHTGSLFNQNPAFLCHPSIIRLIFYDAKYKDNLTVILRAYIESNGNIQEVARRIFMHRNTILTKLKKIESICEIDLSNPNDLYSLEYSLDVLDYSEKVLHLDILDILQKSF